MCGTGVRMHVFLMFVNYKIAPNAKPIPKSVNNATQELFPTSLLADVLRLTLICVLELVYRPMELNAGIVIQVSKSII
jgi:hypothetical protein